MLSQANPIPTIGVRNLNSARYFYEYKLGLEPTGPGNEQVQFYKCGNGLIEIYLSEFGGTNKATTLTFTVGDNIDQEVNLLKNRGVNFEHYQMPDTKLNGDIHIMKDMKAAWFKDPDGNILCIHDH